MTEIKSGDYIVHCTIDSATLFPIINFLFDDQTFRLISQRILQENVDRFFNYSLVVKIKFWTFYYSYNCTSIIMKENFISRLFNNT